MVWAQFIAAYFIHIPMVMLTYAIHSIPLRKNKHQIFLIGIVLGIVYYYTRYIVDTPFYPLIVLSFFIVLIMGVRRYPIFYCFLICTMGYISGVFTDLLVSAFLQYILHISPFPEKTSVKSFLFMNSLFVLFASITAFLLRRYKIGFAFVIKRFRINQVLSNSNYYWAGFLFCGLMITQGTVNSIAWHAMVINMVILLGILLVSYHYNKKARVERFGDNV